ncbi:hypothetical protein NE237_011827 [Protea cynaroides]|uniref:Uncharacterized protein n=1 Tax=Protea cynaroides TaxID=273540 RepID=A0A9Q0H0P4_9MAGN|nr:hypothetical protein NE237_011827 [Protea cynaroides]
MVLLTRDLVEVNELVKMLQGKLTEVEKSCDTFNEWYEEKELEALKASDKVKDLEKMVLDQREEVTKSTLIKSNTLATMEKLDQQVRKTMDRWQSTKSDANIVEWAKEEAERAKKEVEKALEVEWAAHAAALEKHVRVAIEEYKGAAFKGFVTASVRKSLPTLLTGRALRNEAVPKSLRPSTVPPTSEQVLPETPALEAPVQGNPIEAAPSLSMAPRIAAEGQDPDPQVQESSFAPPEAIPTQAIDPPTTTQGADPPIVVSNERNP